MTVQTSMIRTIITSLMLVLMLSGCGFHLRGMTDIPSWFQDIAIIIEQGHRDLEPLLKKELQAYHVVINPNPATARFWLVIEQDKLEQHISSVSSSTTPRQYQLIYTLQFKFEDAKGKQDSASHRIVVTRQATINGNRILGSNEEEALLTSEMRQDAVIQLINRISRFTPVTPPTSNHHAH